MSDWRTSRRGDGGRRWAACAIMLAAAIAGGAGIAAAQEQDKSRSRDNVRETRGDTAFDPVRERFDLAMAHATVSVAAGREQAMLGAPAGERLVVLDAEVLGRLIGQGWAPPGAVAEGQPGASERMRTLIGLARALRLPAAVGAMQASFGTPEEIGLADQLRRVEETKALLAKRPADPALASRLAAEEQALDAALAALPKGPKPDWARTSLDVDRDGKVDAADLQEAEDRRAKAQARRRAPQQAGQVQAAASP